MEFTGNENIYIRKMGEFNESNVNISKDKMTMAITFSPKKGDIYLRYNPKTNGVFALIFNGESDNSFDVAFGAGTETHWGDSIPWLDLFDALFADKEIGHPIMMEMQKKMLKLEGIPIY